MFCLHPQGKRAGISHAEKSEENKAQEGKTGLYKWLTLPPFRWKKKVPLKCKYIYATLHRITAQKQ
jgi:hypothetical protein